MAMKVRKAPYSDVADLDRRLYFTSHTYEYHIKTNKI